MNVAIFASGNGSNAETIARYFEKSNEVKIKLILTNNPKAFVVERAKNLNIPYYIFNREEFYNSDTVIKLLNKHKVDLIILAGFLWLVPERLIKTFEKIVNIHPALLPKYGGKGMYGNKVHEAVKDSGDKKSGITIHWVNEKYDEGEIILQKDCDISPNDTPDSIAEKVHKLEYEFYPKVIAEIAGIES